jgi:hypothetical protein
MVLRRIFRPTRDEIIEGWRKLHNEELHNLYPLPNFIRKIKSSRRKGQDMYHAWERRGMHTGF